MRKQSQRQAGGGQFGDAGAVPKQSGSMARVEIAKSAEAFVITSGECRTRSDIPLRLKDSAIERERELTHSICFVDVFFSKQLGGQTTKCLLGG